MGPNKWLFRSAVSLCAVGIAMVFLVALLGKGGQLDGGRLTGGKIASNIGALALYCSPLLALAALCICWRRNSSLAVAGLIAAAIALGITAWGNLTDYTSWSSVPAPRDQVTYMAGFLAMLGSWAACAVYGVVGLILRRPSGPEA